VRGKFGWEISPSSLSSWVEEFKSICPYARLRPFVAARFSPKEAVEVTTMAHRQIYKFYYHRAKLALILEDFKHRNFTRLRDYLESVSAETPHHYFQKGDRISELKDKFNYKDVYLRDKKNYATRIAQFVLQAVKENKRRHESLQRFMIANDSVTVATEVPVYLTEEDIIHMQNALHFEIAGFDAWKKEKDRILITGHIDVLQVRNGQVHILDFKPHADKERPIEQLTWYALALSRLTGIRLYEFVCGWFDDEHYYEFYPLHIVYKKKKKTAKKWSGTLKVGVARELVAVGKNRAR
ncbi:MAG: PD-(D/E)XK nuclease family protein, partial [Patescibacteria group bacterium]